MDCSVVAGRSTARLSYVGGFRWTGFAGSGRFRLQHERFWQAAADAGTGETAGWERSDGVMSW